MLIERIVKAILIGLVMGILAALAMRVGMISDESFDGVMMVILAFVVINVALGIHQAIKSEPAVEFGPTAMAGHIQDPTQCAIRMHQNHWTVVDTSNDEVIYIGRCLAECQAWLRH